jgi:tetrahydromethanopterin S-methyltransferase subunit B
MPFSYKDYTGDGSTTTFSITFDYQNQSEISVTVDGVAQSGFTFPSSTQVQLTTAPAASSLVRVRRTTSLTSREVDFASGSVLTEEDLDNSNIQVFHAAQEAIDTANGAITLDDDDKWDAQSKVIKNVANPVNNTDAVNKQFISTNLPNINTVAGISSDVTTVAGIDTDVTTVAGNNANVTTVATNIADVNTVATNIADVITVADDLNEAISEIETAANDLNEAVSEIDTVSNSIANVNTVGTNIADVNTVAGNNANVTTVAGISSNVTTVAGISTDVSTVASNNANVTTVAGNDANITTVAGINSAVTTVSNINADVTAVAADQADIGTVATDIANVNAVAGNSTNINNVAGNATNINAVAGNATNINTVAGANTNISTVATNIADVNNFADTYFVGTTAPASPTTGDLWFDSNPSVLVMKVYNGSGFVNAGSAVNGTADRESYVVGTSSGSYTGSTTVFPATYDSGFVDLYLNGVKLVNGTDFTATNGTSITLTSAAATGDTVDIISFGTFTLANIAANDLTDVYTTGVADGQILQYSGTNSRFEPVTFQGGAGYFVGENGTTGNTSTGLGDIFRVHEAALDTATTIPSNTNALAAGPLTLNAALTVNGTVTVV